MFGRATIRLGIGPHSSFVCFSQKKEERVNVGLCLFVRPSGTEDVVRVYAEADTQVIVAFFICCSLMCKKSLVQCCDSAGRLLQTRHRASTSMYSLTFCVRFLLPERDRGSLQSRPPK